MNRKAKGISAERELMHLFWATPGWTACRVAGSGAIRYPAPDVIAAGSRRILAVECKACADTAQYFPADEIDQLQAYAVLAHAEPWLAVRFDRAGWEFFPPDGLERTPTARVARKGTGMPFNAILGHAKAYN